MTAAVTDLKRVPLFQGMTDRALEAIAGLAHEIAFEDGAPLTTEGDDGDAFFMLLDGRVEVTRGGASIRPLGPGDFIGEISLIDGRPGRLRRRRRPRARARGVPSPSSSS